MALSVICLQVFNHIKPVPSGSFNSSRILKTTKQQLNNRRSLSWKYLDLGAKKERNLHNDKIRCRVPLHSVCSQPTSFLNLKRSEMEIQTFVFMDCETTGLPFQEYYKTRITELSLAAVESNHLSLGVYPRVLNKISLCFNPNKMISPGSTEITGLSNELLEYQPKFDEAAITLLNNFLSLCKKPVCMVAHNGFGFDYPILKYELEKSGGDFDSELLCCDTLLMFRQMHKQEQEEIAKKPKEEIPLEFQDDFDSVLLEAVESFEKSQKIDNVMRRNETTPKRNVSRVEIDGVVGDSLYYLPGGDVGVSQNVKPVSTARRQLKLGRPSFKLGDIYKRLTKKEPVNAHRAECDINMLIECAAVLNEKFIRLANETAKKFSEVKKMGPKVINS